MLLSNAPLYYPSAREWMWDYCIYLGPFTDSKGDNYDLGIYIKIDVKLKYYSVSNASVYGDKPGEYFSGIFPKSEVYIEALRRAKLLGIVRKDYNPE